jgi:ribosomal protein S27AE
MSSSLEDGEICPSCGEVPIFFYGYEAAECPNCGEEFFLDEDSD